MERCGIVGFGCAGYHGAKALRDSGYTGEIHVFTGDDEELFNPMLTTYVAGGKLDEATAFPFGNLTDVAAALQITVHKDSVESVHSKENAQMRRLCRETAPRHGACMCTRMSNWSLKGIHRRGI